MRMSEKTIRYFIEFDGTWAYLGPDISCVEAQIKESLEIDDDDGREFKAVYMTDKEVSELKDL
jgi:hypothetical protein